MRDKELKPRSKGKSPRNAIYLVTVSDDFRPQRPWDLPDQIIAAELLEKNLSWAHAVGFVRTFNKHAMGHGFPDRQWAVAVGHARYRWRKGGVA